MAIDPTNHRVLVVDDDEDGRTLMEHILRDAGFEVDTAADGRAALEQLDTFKPDLVLLDLVMPFVDGFDVLEHIRSRGEAPRVIVVTGRTDVRMFARGVREGATAYLTKPFGFEELLDTIDHVLRAGEPEDERRTTTDRRSENRRVLVVEVRVDCEAKSCPTIGELTNLSAGGLQLETHQPLEVGATVMVAFAIPGAAGNFRLEGRVQWRTSSGLGSYLQGISCTDAEPEVVHQIRTMLGPPQIMA